MVHNIQYLKVFLYGFIILLFLNTYNIANSHLSNKTAIQEIVDDYDQIQIKFAYDQQKVNINTLTKLNFSILNSKTNEHIKHFLARTVVIEEGSEEFKIDNVKVNDGDFSLNHSFINYGNHQILLRIDTNSSIIVASFNVFIPLYQLTPNFTTYLIVIIGLPILIVITIIFFLILRKK